MLILQMIPGSQAGTGDRQDHLTVLHFLNYEPFPDCFY